MVPVPQHQPINKEDYSGKKILWHKILICGPQGIKKIFFPPDITLKMVLLKKKKILKETTLLRSCLFQHV